MIEAKEDQSYTLAKARAEIEVARNNRDAQVGVFVFSAKSVGDGIESLTRFGDDVVVIWDPENSSTDMYLKAAISLARALCVRSNRLDEATSADFTEIDRAILEIEKRANSLGDIETWTKTIHSNAEKVLKRVESSRKSFSRQLEVLREKTSENEAGVWRSQRGGIDVRQLGRQASARFGLTLLGDGEIGNHSLSGGWLGCQKARGLEKRHDRSFLRLVIHSAGVFLTCRAVENDGLQRFSACCRMSQDPWMALGEIADSAFRNCRCRELGEGALTWRLWERFVVFRSKSAYFLVILYVTSQS